MSRRGRLTHAHRGAAAREAARPCLYYTWAVVTKTPATALPSRDPNLPPPLPVRRFTVEEYHRLAEAGILNEDDRVELLEGWIVPKMVHGPAHDNAIELLDEAIRPHLPQGWRLRIQSSVSTTDSEPEPAVTVVRGSARERRARHPEPGDIGLIVEVAETSLDTGRGTKARLYARAAIASYWIVNLVDGRLEVYGEPSGPHSDPRYHRFESLAPGEQVELALDGAAVATIEVTSLLP